MRAGKYFVYRLILVRANFRLWILKGLGRARTERQDAGHERRLTHRSRERAEERHLRLHLRAAEEGVDAAGPMHRAGAGAVQEASPLQLSKALTK